MGAKFVGSGMRLEVKVKSRPFSNFPGWDTEAWRRDRPDWAWVAGNFLTSHSRDPMVMPSLDLTFEPRN